ncbi:MAG: alpha-amylase family glycosyl hydrolase [Chitinivibrionales bacterium]|nr:alpha-amylase family glycosyl hydrolase [Chitinivibrionales bacterium]
MNNLASILAAGAPRSIGAALANWPVRAYRGSPADWRDQVFYFLLPDRFSNGKESPENLLDVDLSTPAGIAAVKNIRNGLAWQWNNWQDSGANYFQGGTIPGIKSKLGYLKDLGITTIWVGPVFRQRVDLNTYHGYGIQDFFEIDPRFGTRADLVDLVDTAHAPAYGMNVVLDVIFNHAGRNWFYDLSAGNGDQPPYLPNGSYLPIWPSNGYGTAITNAGQALGNDDYIWPQDFQDYGNFVRAGSGNLGAGDINDDYAEHKRTDFCDLRKLNVYSDDTLRSLILAYQYWIALADLDGFRIDTFKHVTQDQARNFCNAIKEYAENIGKNDFFLVAEVAGGNSAEDRYLSVTGRNLNACLDIGEQRETICNVAKGLQGPADFFAGFNYYDPGMGSHRNYGSQVLSISNDHDQISGTKVRFAADASNDHQAAAAVALQLFTLGIPCLYYGMEQGLAGGAEADQRQWLSNWGGADCFLREAMFGPQHPRAAGFAGTGSDPATSLAAGVVGFGPHGTAGRHVFNPGHPIYKRVSQLANCRAAFKPLRRGRQYQRQTRFLNNPFAFYGAGEIMAWSRVFDDQEVLVVINPHGTAARGAQIIVDRNLSPGGMTIVLNTDPSAPSGMQAGATVAVNNDNQTCSVALDAWLLGPSEVVVLANKSALDEQV